MRKILASVLAMLILFSLTGCSLIEKFTGGAADEGSVKIVSGGVDFDAYEVKTAEHGKTNAEYDYDLASAAAKAVEVPYNSDFAVKLEGDRVGDVTYSLYDDQLDECYASQSSLTLPASSGSWCCVVNVSWGKDDDYSSYAYFFKINRTE